MLIMLNLVFVVLIGLIASRDVVGQAVDAVPPVVLVTNSYACTLTKHPTLPVLYLTANSAPESKNLITVRLNADGSLAADGQKAWPDYFTINPTNSSFRYSIPRPVVVADEKILYLGAWPADSALFDVTNNNSVAAVSLDEQGQPVKLLKAFRTTHTELGVLAMAWD